jgi:hypothetical protein
MSLNVSLLRRQLSLMNRNRAVLLCNIKLGSVLAAHLIPVGASLQTRADVLFGGMKFHNFQHARSGETASITWQAASSLSQLGPRELIIC